MTDLLDIEINDLLKFLQPTTDEVALRNVAICNLTEAIQTLWPNAKVHLFGSFDTGLFLPNSDIDLVVHLEEAGGSSSSQSRTPKPDAADQPLDTMSPPLVVQQQQQPATTLSDVNTASDIKRMGELAEALQASGVVSEMRFLPNARVPLIKCRERLTQFDFDISFNHLEGEQGAVFTKSTMKRYPLLRPLVVLLKFTLATRSLNETYNGGLGSFALLLLALRYHQLVENDYYQTAHVGNMFLGFLDFFGRRFNYVYYAISVRDGGGFMPKEMLGPPDPMRPYLLCLENPLRRYVDVGRSAFNILRIQHSFKETFEGVVNHMETVRIKFAQRYEALMHQGLPVEPNLALDVYKELKQGGGGGMAIANGKSSHTPPPPPPTPPPPAAGNGSTPPIAANALRIPPPVSFSAFRIPPPSIDTSSDGGFASQTVSSPESPMDADFPPPAHQPAKDDDDDASGSMTTTTATTTTTTTTTSSTSDEDDISGGGKIDHLNVPKMYLLEPLVADSSEIERLLQFRRRLQDIAISNMATSSANDKSSHSTTPHSSAGGLSHSNSMEAILPMSPVVSKAVSTPIAVPLSPAKKKSDEMDIYVGGSPSSVASVVPLQGSPLRKLSFPSLQPQLPASSLGSSSSSGGSGGNTDEQHVSSAPIAFSASMPTLAAASSSSYSSASIDHSASTSRLSSSPVKSSLSRAEASPLRPIPPVPFINLLSPSAKAHQQYLALLSSSASSTSSSPTVIATTAMRSLGLVTPDISRAKKRTSDHLLHSGPSSLEDESAMQSSSATASANAAAPAGPTAAFDGVTFPGDVMHTLTVQTDLDFPTFQATPERSASNSSLTTPVHRTGIK